MEQPITLLYVPADRPDRIPKACASGADAVIVDLEDAVAPARKAEARSSLSLGVESRAPGQSLQVRINAPGTPWFDDDLEAVSALPSDVGVRIPKVEGPETLEVLRRRWGDRPLHPLVESARGLAAVDEICAAGPAGIGIGEADLRSELGIADGPAIDWLRTRLVVAARTAGLPAPAMSAFTRVGDDEGLEADCRRGRDCGQLGRSAIHPRQLAVIRRAFCPDADELERAEGLLAGLGDAVEAGSGVVVLADGRFADRAMVQGARRTVSLHRRLSAHL